MCEDSHKSEEEKKDKGRMGSDWDLAAAEDRAGRVGT
jgi:hypothetical protein